MAGSAGTAGMSAGVACEEVECVKPLLLECNGCHGAGVALGKLDLGSPNVASRLKDVAAMHDSPGMGAQCPTGDKLVNSANVAESWLLKKINGEQGNCGTVMPSTGKLNGADLTCMQAFVTCIATGGT